MNTINNPVKYSLGSRMIHWLMAILLIVNITIGFLFDYLSPLNKQYLIPLHQILGILLIGLFTIRILLLITSKRPVLSINISHIEILGIRLIHSLIYYLMLTIPVSGLFKIQAKGKTLTLIGYKMPFFVYKNSTSYDFFSNYHESATIVLVALIVLHIFGILKQHYIKKEKILHRMSF